LPANLYVHFPFCRRKCSYCALYSRAGASVDERDAYVRRIATEIRAACETPCVGFKTVYFGGGSPALCNLSLLNLRPSTFDLQPSCEFTVELHPLDVTEAKLDELKALGVNRISMGVQSFDDATLKSMGRGYVIEEALKAFRLVKTRFDNAGIDLIVGYPGERGVGEGWFERFRDAGLRHCSVYSLQNERGLKGVPDDDVVLDRIRDVARRLGELGLERYEISNYAQPGFECRHNLAVWRGEDYLGIGDGAYGRVGLRRTPSGECLSPAQDLKERTIFRLRTREGLDAARYPEWGPILAKYVEEGLLLQDGSLYRLTDRGTEVCDSILAELV